MKFLRPIAWVLVLGAAAGCQQKMARQPAYRPLRPSTYFADGQSARPLLAGTVARGSLERELPAPPGGADLVARVALALGGSPANALGTLAQLTALGAYAEFFPQPVDGQMLARGQRQFNIFCSPCHDRAGTGRGIVVERGFTAPPSFHTDDSRGFALKGQKLRLREAPVGYYFEVITRGYGAMPDYAERIAPADRWAIVAYIRALQLSQHATLADVADANARAALEAAAQDQAEGKAP